MVKLSAYERKQMAKVPFNETKFRKSVGVGALFGEAGYTPDEQRAARPTFDRVDIHLEVHLVNFRELSSNASGGGKSETIRRRVIAARQIQVERLRKSSHSSNSAMGSRQGCGRPCRFFTASVERFARCFSIWEDPW